MSSTFDQAKQHPDLETAEAKLAKIAQLKTDISRLKSVLSQQGDSGNQGGASAADAIDIQRLIDLNILPMHRGDAFGTIFYVNDAMVNLLGYSREEYLTGKIRWQMITPPEFVGAGRDAIEQLNATGKAAPWEKQYICKDGSRKSVVIGMIAANRSLSDCFVFIVDVTERKRAEAELQESEMKLRSLAEAIPDMVWMSDPEGKVSYHNKRYYDYTGVTPEEDNGWHWLSRVHHEDRDEFLARVGQARQTGQSFQFEYRYRSAGGDYRWFLCRGLPLKDNDGRLTNFFGTCTDIDNRKQMEAELRESEARFQALANAIPQIVWAARKDGTIDFFNDRWFEYTGLTYEQSRGDGWELLIHPQDREAYLDGWRNALSTGDSFEKEFRLRRAAGFGRRTAQPYLWHLCRAVALRDDKGAVIKWFGTWTEIEDQKRDQKRSP
jgi:PAS domain S-box-containing protein